MTRPIFIDQLINEFNNTNTDRTVQAELKFWVNKITDVLETPDRTTLLYLTRLALQAKMAWPEEANEAWTGSGDIPGYIMLEELLTSMYNRVIQSDTLDQRDIQTFHIMCFTLLSSL